MLYDTLLAEARRNDTLDDVRVAALGDARWLLDLADRDRADAGEPYVVAYERGRARIRAELDGRLTTRPDADARAFVLCLLLAAADDGRPPGRGPR